MSGKPFTRSKLAALLCAALISAPWADGAARAQQQSAPQTPSAQSAPATPAPSPSPSPAPSAPAPQKPSQPAAAPAAPQAEAPKAPLPAPPGAAAPNDAAESPTLQLPGRPAAYIESKAAWDEGFSAINGAVAAINGELDKAGLKPTGRPLAVFTETDDAGFRFRAMVPIDAIPADKTSLSDTVKLGQTPNGKAMKFEHRGAYTDIDSTYEAITAFLDEKGLEEQNIFYEEYLNDVKSPDDPTLEVDIYVLIK
jgi:effector-binding domain-containing protein